MFKLNRVNTQDVLSVFPRLTSLILLQPLQITLHLLIEPSFRHAHWHEISEKQDFHRLPSMPQAKNPMRRLPAGMPNVSDTWHDLRVQFRAGFPQDSLKGVHSGAKDQNHKLEGILDQILDAQGTKVRDELLRRMRQQREGAYGSNMIITRGRIPEEEEDAQSHSSDGTPARANEEADVLKDMTSLLAHLHVDEKGTIYSVGATSNVVDMKPRRPSAAELGQSPEALTSPSTSIGPSSTGASIGATSYLTYTSRASPYPTLVHLAASRFLFVLSPQVHERSGERKWELFLTDAARGSSGSRLSLQRPCRRRTRAYVLRSGQEATGRWN